MSIEIVHKVFEGCYVHCMRNYAGDTAQMTCSVRTRIDPPLLSAFQDACRDVGKRPSEAIREMIEAFVEAGRDRPEGAER